MRLETDSENIREIAPTGVRIPSALKEKLKIAAKQKNQSMAAEIVERLQESFAKEVSAAELLEKIEELRNEFNAKLDVVLKRLEEK